MSADRNFTRAQEQAVALVSQNMDRFRVGQQRELDEDGLLEWSLTEFRRLHPRAVKTMLDELLRRFMKATIDAEVRLRATSYILGGEVFAQERAMRRPRVPGQRRRPAFDLDDCTIAQVQIMRDSDAKLRDGATSRLRIYDRILRTARKLKVPDSTLVRELGLKRIYVPRTKSA